MSLNIRPATASDAPQWLDLVRAALGDHYPAKEIYDVNWVAAQIDPASGQETWVADLDGRLDATISFLKPDGPNVNPVANLGRNLIRPGTVASGAADALFRSVNDLAIQRGEMAIVRVSAMDNTQQALFEAGLLVRRFPAPQAPHATARWHPLLRSRRKLSPGHSQPPFRVPTTSQRIGPGRPSKTANPQHHGCPGRRQRLPAPM